MIDLAMEQKNRRVLAKYFKEKADTTQDVSLKAEYLERSRTHGYKAEVTEMDKAPKKVAKKACPQCEQCS